MRVLITGGTGMIGTALAAELSATGHQVVLLSRQPRRVRRLPPSVLVHEWDARGARGWGALLEGDMAVINLAGENIGSGRWTPARQRRIRESRLQAGAAVVEAVREAAHPPRVVIQASGVGYYGASQQPGLAETAGPGSDFLARVCVEWEASTAPVEALGVRRVITRSGLVLSRAGGALPRLLLPYRLLVGGPLGTGRQGWPWIHLADEVRAIRFLVEHEAARGPFNLVAPELVDNAEFSHAVGQALKRPALLRVPGFGLRLLFGEQANALLTGQWPSPARLLDLGFAFDFPTVEPALRDLLR